MKPRPSLLLLGIAFALAVLLTRTWGVHVDEIGYFDVAIRAPLGDAPTSGKPLAFYVLNYSLYHLFRPLSFWLHPLILPLFYVVATVLAIWYLAVSASRADARLGWTFALLLLSPFALFNATQLMMETPLLPLSSVTLAVLLSMMSGSEQPRLGLWLAVSAASATLLKNTMLPAVLVLAAACFPVLRFRIWPLVVGALAGTLGNAALLLAIHAAPSRYYGGLSQLLASLAGALTPKTTGQYFEMWLFFAGIPLVGAVWSWWERRDALARTLLAVGVFSAVGVVFVQLATDPALPFPRYAYPVM